MPPPYFPSLAAWRAGAAVAPVPVPSDSNIDDSSVGGGAHARENAGSDGSDGGEAPLRSLVAASAVDMKAALDARPQDALLARAAASDRARDEILQRYLVSCSLDTGRAHKRLAQTLEWRARHRLESIPYNILAAHGVRMPLVVSRLGLGTNGEALIYVAPRHGVKPLDYPALEKAIGVLFDSLLYTPPPQGCQASSIFVVVDLHGMALSQVDLQSFRVGIPVYLNHYAGACARICILNYTYPMHAVWKFVSCLLDQETRERIVFVTGSALRREIGKVFSAETVPHWLGGTGKSANETQGVFLESGIAVDTDSLMSRLFES